MKNTLFNKYSFVWVTSVMFLGSIAAHWTLAWKAYEHDRIEHHEPIIVNDYLIEVSRDTFENWQSEFLQLIWQVGGLSFLYFVGSSQSKEGDERKEEKIDMIIKMLDPDQGEKNIRQLEIKYPKK